MRLVLEQTTWKELEVAVAATAALPHIVLVPVAPWGEDIPMRRQEAVSWNVPAGATIKTVSEELTKSSVEWPMRLIEAHVMRGDEVIEARLCALYVLLEYWAGAIWRGPLSTLNAKRDEILAAIAGGRPDWRRREIIALSQLYESA